MSALSRSLITVALVSGLGLYASQLLAQQEAPPPPPIPETDTPRTPVPPAADSENPEPLPPKIVDEELQPSVTIRKEGGKTYEEYRQDGRVYMIKVTPENGPPYYLLDTDGDGSLETHSDDQRGQPVKPVYWKLKEW